MDTSVGFHVKGSKVYNQGVRVYDLGFGVSRCGGLKCERLDVGLMLRARI